MKKNIFEMICNRINEMNKEAHITILDDETQGRYYIFYEDFYCNCSAYIPFNTLSEFIEWLYE